MACFRSIVHHGVWGVLFSRTIEHQSLQEPLARLCEQWVAEVCAAREVGRELTAYKNKKGTVLELKRKRAEAKMYNEASTYPSPGVHTPYQPRGSVRCSQARSRKHVLMLGKRLLLVHSGTTDNISA